MSRNDEAELADSWQNHVMGGGGSDPYLAFPLVPAVKAISLHGIPLGGGGSLWGERPGMTRQSQQTAKKNALWDLGGRGVIPAQFSHL